MCATDHEFGMRKGAVLGLQVFCEVEWLGPVRASFETHVQQELAVPSHRVRPLIWRGKGQLKAQPPKDKTRSCCLYVTFRFVPRPIVRFSAGC